MMDILERLRKPINEKEDYFISQWPNEEPYTKDVVRFEAADEIERLRDEVDFQLHKRKEDADEIERLREALDDMIQFVRKEYGSNDVRVQRAEAALKEKE